MDEIMILYDKEFQNEKDAIALFEMILHEGGYADYHFDEEYSVWVVEVWE